MTTGSLQPLDGVQVLDFTRLLPGPWATAIAAELGAKVLKIEQPNKPDYSRSAAPFVEGQSVYFAGANRNKVGVNVDIATPSGQRAVRELIRHADVLVESFRPGTLAKFGLDFDEVARINPSIVYCSLSGFGQSGNRASAAGHDLNIAGLAGFLWDRDGRPSVSGVQMADFAAGTTLVMGILGGVLEQRRTGNPLWIDVSMLDSLLSWGLVRHSSALAAISGSSDTRRLEAFGANPRYALYECADGLWLSASLLEAKYWAKFCELIDRTDLVDPSEQDESRLSRHGDQSDVYRDILTAVFKQRSREEWCALAQEHSIPCFPVYAPDEVWDDPHIRSRHMLVEEAEADKSISGGAKLIRGPLRSSGSRDAESYVPFEEIDVDKAMSYFDR